jgi:CysZ protein
VIAAHPRLWPWAVLPAVFTGTLLVAAVTLSWGPIAGFVERALPGNPFAGTGLADHLDTLRTAAAWVVRGALTGLVVVGATIVGSMAASPFHDRLSAGVEAVVLGEDHTPFDLRRTLGDVSVGLGHSVLAIGLSTALSCGTVVLGLVPIVGVVLQLGAGLAISGMLSANEALDFTWARRRLTFAEKLRVLWDERAVTGGFGAALLALVSIPLLNVVTLPVGVAAATLLALELEAAGLTPRRDAVAAQAAGEGRPAPT